MSFPQFYTQDLPFTSLFIFFHLLFSTASVLHWVSPSPSVSRTCPSWGDLCTKNCVIASSHCDICVKAAQPVGGKRYICPKSLRDFTMRIFHPHSLLFLFCITFSVGFVLEPNILTERSEVINCWQPVLPLWCTA